VELEYRVVKAQCDQFGFNDDPLTFYCNEKWWTKKDTKNTEPLGESMTCPKEKEIPVGNTVDDAEKWAEAFISTIDGFIENSAKPLINYLAMIGSRPQGSYCECGSTCLSGDYACLPWCKEGTADVFDEEGNATGETKQVCERKDCDGNPCQQMIGFLIGGSGPCGGTGIKFYSEQIKQGLKTVEKFVLADQRSDILKELEQSRNGVNSCSQNYSKEARILSCTRVEDEIMPPIIGSTKPGVAIINGKKETSYCYGQALGEVTGAGQRADNWFCCQSK